jgi:hypothetical protein
VHVIKIKEFARSFYARLHQLLLAHVLQSFCEFASDIEKISNHLPEARFMGATNLSGAFSFYISIISQSSSSSMADFASIDISAAASDLSFRYCRGLGSSLTLRLTGIGFPDSVSDCSLNGPTFESASSESDVKSSQYRRGILRGLMAVSRGLCFATGGPQSSGQSPSFKLCPVNYSVEAMANTITKSATGRPKSMFPSGKKSETCSRVPDGSHAHLGA